MWTVSQLRSLGLSPHRIRTLAADGTLLRLSRGWYGTQRTPDDVASALRTGRRLTCISALAYAGVWVPRDNLLHVAELRSGRVQKGEASSARLTTTMARHRFRSAWADPAAPILGLRESLEDALACLGAEDLAIVLESAAERRLVDAGGIDELLDQLPVKKRRAVGHVSMRAQSGTETRVRRFLTRLGVRVREQVGLLPGEYMDLLVGEVLVIECDSRAHHTDRAAYASDRRRDRELIRRGFRVVRLTWEDVMLHWDRTKEFLRSLITQGLHRAPRRKGSEGQRGRRLPRI